MDYEPAYFSEAPIGSISKSSCSPDVSNNFLGIKISAPKSARVDDFDEIVLPVCVVYQLTLDQTIDAPPLSVSVVRQSDMKEFVGALGYDSDEFDADEPEDPPPDDALPISKDALASTLSIGWFHIDLAQILPAVAWNDIYEIRVHFANNVSNSIRFDVR